ncbi:hypothetical protein ASG48_14910 [Aurantimonas sp. Leaf443]|nr:hypothetical protein ASG48_14910 [Aurantimonas sp. Leaf443]
MSDTMRLQSFDLATQDIAEADLDGLHALSISVGWPHRRSDWSLFRSLGRGLAAFDDIGRVFASAMWFDHGETVATIGMVITSPRVQTHGGGRFMMEHILRECGARSLMLNSTRAAHALYLSLGFEVQAVVCQMQGIVREGSGAPKLDASAVEVLAPDDLPRIVALDKAAFGADRSVVLTRLAPLSRIVGIRRNGHLEAYAMRRPFGRGTVIGPVVAHSEDDAILLSASLLGDLGGRFARLDTRQPEGRFRTFLQSSGLELYDTVKTMTRGAPLAAVRPGQPGIYALAAQPLG